MRHSHLPWKLRAIPAVLGGAGLPGRAGNGALVPAAVAARSRVALDSHLEKPAHPGGATGGGGRVRGWRIGSGAGGTPASDFRCSTRTARLSMEKRGGKPSRSRAPRRNSAAQARQGRVPSMRR
ncbi:hypothetical protein [Azospirillum largimobile]